MAKKSDDDDGKFVKMDNESLEFLEQIRKGKSRNFVMSVKGAKVRSLLVKKKKVKETEIKEARGGGFQPIYGVAEGQGNNITFYLALSDGFEKDPLGGKVAKLKEFLKDQTGKAFKPTIKLVSTPPPIPFEEEDLKNPLIASFVKLEPQIEQVIQQHPESADPVKQLSQEIRSLLRDDQKIDNAGPKIAELENLLNGFDLKQPASPTESEVQSDAPPTAPPPASGTSTRSPLATKLGEGLKKLKPAVQEAITKVPERKQELMESLTSVVADIKAENLDVAKTKFVELGKLIQEIRASATSSTSAPSNDSNAQDESANKVLAGKLAEALKKLKPAADKIIEVMPDKKAELYGEIAKIAGEIKGDQFSEAKASIAEFAPLLKSLQQEALTSSTREPSATGDDDASSSSDTSSATGTSSSQESSSSSSVEDSGTNEDDGTSEENTSSDSPTDQMARFYARRESMNARFLEACRDIERKGDLQRFWGASESSAEKGDFENAFKILDRVENMIGETEAAQSQAEDAEPSGVSAEMAFKQARLKWSFAKDKVNQELRSLKELIVNASDDEEDEIKNYIAQELEAQTQDIYDNLMDRSRKLQDLLDAKVEAQSESDQQEAITAAQDALDEYESYISDDPNVQDLDDSPFGKVAVKQTMLGSIRELRKTLFI